MITILQVEQSAMPSIVMMVALFAIVYFFMIRPQSKRQKEIEKFRNSLTIGQDVVTTGGIHGTVKAVDTTTVTLKVATGVEIVFDKSAIVGGTK
ncbi:MAG: preprotein translocase subunit YajC [Bacteroidaceae bacterium]|nr:preprotein translocase subunit YajC [Bacteroidaceae bacterium]